MKVIVYMRFAKTSKKILVDADTKRNLSPLKTQRMFGKHKYHPTIYFPVQFELPDDAFFISNKYLALALTKPAPCVEIKEVEDPKEMRPQCEAADVKEAK